MPPSSGSTSPDIRPSTASSAKSKGKAKETYLPDGPLQRGSACLACRKRKLRCDAKKPTCQQCMRAGKPGDCSYDNGKALSKTQLLQKRIAQLEEKLRQMQAARSEGSSPASSSGSDYRPSSSSAHRRAKSGRHTAADQRTQEDLIQETLTMLSRELVDSTANDIAMAQADDFGGPADLDLTSESLLPSAFDIIPSVYGSSGDNEDHHRAPSSSSSLSIDRTIDEWGAGGDLNPLYHSLDHSTSDITLQADGRQYLLQIFLPRRRECLFDVHVPRFLQSLEVNPPEKRPHPCLLEAIFLVACHISGNEALQVYEPKLLSRARQGLCDALEYSDRLWNFVQASTLIAFYLYRKGRFIEAYHQTCQVARFAVSCGLHQVASPVWPEEDVTGAPRALAPWTVTNMSVRRGGSMLDAPRDSIELGERILAFWGIFLLDKCGSVVTNLPAALPDETDSFSQVETVWPRTLEEFEQRGVTDLDYGTVRYLYEAQLPRSFARPDTTFTLRLKASALFERASRMGAKYSNSMSDVSWNLFQTINFAIDRFVPTIPYIRNLGTMGEISGTRTTAVNPQLVFAHTLAHAATIQLHNTAASDDPASYAKCLNAANAVVLVAQDMGPDVDFSAFDMLLGHCWKIICDALLRERLRLVGGEEISILDVKLDTIIAQMRMLETVFPLLGFQIADVVQSRQIGLWVNAA